MANVKFENAPSNTPCSSESCSETASKNINGLPLCWECLYDLIRQLNRDPLYAPNSSKSN